MVEPEVAFNNLEDNIDLAENFLKYVINYVLKNCKEDLDFLNARHADLQKQKPEKDRDKEGLIEKLQNIITKRFKRVSIGNWNFPFLFSLEFFRISIASV